MNNGVEVLILQHPLEVNNAKGSVRLLDLCLQHSRVLTGEVFTAETLMQALYAPADVLADVAADATMDVRGLWRKFGLCCSILIRLSSKPQIWPCLWPKNIRKVSKYKDSGW